MFHSHLGIRHLIRQLDLKGQPRSVSTPPPWLVTFLEETAELFEPLTGDARVGYECRRGQSGWELMLFLGRNEIVGGFNDGLVRAVNFRFDVARLAQRFERIESLSWNAVPSPEAESETSFLSVIGSCSGEAIRLDVLASPPERTAPALKVYPDGRSEMNETR